MISRYISGASLKLTILNDRGRVWTMVAGGGASVVYADTVADYGYSHELANYGEYSGAPSTDETYEYAKTLIKLMTRYKHPEGKVFIIGGGKKFTWFQDSRESRVKFRLTWIKTHMNLVRFSIHVNLA